MRNQYHHVHIDRIIEHSEDVRSFIFDNGGLNFDSKPGQFVMVWLPGIDEKPFSLSSKNMITVERVGPFTEKLFQKKRGFLDIRGPYGNGFPRMRFSTIIGGGCGIAPLHHFIGDSVPGLSYVLAGETRDDLIFLEDFLKSVEEGKHYSGNKVVTATKDGSHGIKGIATDIEIPDKGGDFYVCGPEVMMQKVAVKLVNEGVKDKRIFLSMERYMKCGGMGPRCGSCLISGYPVCSDGPVFRYDKIKDLSHFNKFRRTRTGELEKLI